MNGVEVSERGPEVATEETPFKPNPYTEILNRARVKSANSGRSSLSVPAAGMSLPTDDLASSIEPHTFGASDPSKSLRTAANITPDANSERGWSRLVLAGVTAALIGGIGLITRKRMSCEDSEDNDIEGGTALEQTPLVRVAEVKVPATDPFHPKDDALKTTPPQSLAKVEMPANDAYHAKDDRTTSASQSVMASQFPSHQAIVSDPMTSFTEGGGFTIEQEDNLFHDQKEAADAIRKWMQMLRKNRRARRQKRNHSLQRMRRMRLQRLKAARLQMQRKMRADYGIANDPGLEKRISQEKDDGMTAPIAFYGRDPHQVVSMMMRLLRIALQAFKRARERTT
jgi:hypothetical protein